MTGINNKAHSHKHPGTGASYEEDKQKLAALKHEIPPCDHSPSLHMGLHIVKISLGQETHMQAKTPHSFHSICRKGLRYDIRNTPC